MRCGAAANEPSERPRRRSVRSERLEGAYGTARTTWAPASSRNSAVSTAWSATTTRANGTLAAGPALRHSRSRRPRPEPAVTHTTPAAAAAAVRRTLSLSDGCNATTEAR